MVIKPGLAGVAAAVFLLLAPSAAMAHGKALTLGKAEDAAGAFGPGARLEPFKPKREVSAISWLLAVGPGGRKLGLVGVAKEETDHGYLAQATALGMDGKILTVIPLKVMEDEKAPVYLLTQADGWWREGAPVKPEGAGLILIKSARKTADAAIPILAEIR